MKNNANSAATTANGAISTEDAPQLSRGLSLRHIMFIALGSAIGTGLFYGSASAIQLAGPAVLLAYVIGGAAVFMVMRAMGSSHWHTRIWRILGIRNPVSGTLGWVRHRLELCSGNGARCHRGCDSICSIYEILVPPVALVDLDRIGAAHFARH